MNSSNQKAGPVLSLQQGSHNPFTDACSQTCCAEAQIKWIKIHL